MEEVFDQHRLAESVWPDEYDVGGVVDEGELEEFFDEEAVDALGPGPVEVGDGLEGAEERKFLGFNIANDGSERRIAPHALAKFKAGIRDLTSRTRGISLRRMIESLKPYLLGWRGYFGFCQTPHVLTSLERWIRRRLRAYLWRQWNNGPKRFRELRRRGLSTFQVAIAAGSPPACWRMARHVAAVQQALRNRYFDSLGLPRLYTPAEA